MFETGRRSAVSSSELGLYSDRAERYQRNRYNPIVKKFTIGVMVVVAVILVAIFLYDFTSATAANSKVSQETKHIYILQNALKKSVNASRRLTNATILPETHVNGNASSILMQDRSDVSDDDISSTSKAEEHAEMRSDTVFLEPEAKAQNLHNFKLRKRVLKSVESDGYEDEEMPEEKQLFDNHAVVYRVRQRYKRPDSEEESEESEEYQPTPFHWEFKTAHPTSFKRYKYPQLSQYRYPHSSRNIQDIIKYLTNNVELPNRGIKFTGVYVNPKKYDLYPELGEMMSNSDRSEEEQSSSYSIGLGGDPFYQYKPKHPSDVNLLATSNVRFSPTGIHRYNPYHESFYTRPSLHTNSKPAASDNSYDNVNPYMANFQKKRKPKPFSVMLDIYPITDIGENKKALKPMLPPPMDEYDIRRPMHYNRGNKYYPSASPSSPIIAFPHQQPISEEEERQQMIFHLNLYPRKKNKLSRNAIIQKSEDMLPEERQQFVDKIMSPIGSIAKRLTDQATIEESTFDEQETTTVSISRYQESSLHERRKIDADESEEYSTVPSNHKSNDEDYANTDKYEYEAQKMTTTRRTCFDCETTTNNKSESSEKQSVDADDIDTVEGFQRFSDGLLATE